MNWRHITNITELETAFTESLDKPVLLFKHSTRCSISTSALSRIERKWESVLNEKVIPFYIDLIRYREVSNAIEKLTGIEHESPQVIIMHHGKILYQATHNGIQFEDVVKSLKAA